MLLYFHFKMAMSCLPTRKKERNTHWMEIHKVTTAGRPPLPGQAPCTRNAAASLEALGPSRPSLGTEHCPSATTGLVQCGRPHRGVAVPVTVRGHLPHAGSPLCSPFTPSATLSSGNAGARSVSDASGQLPAPWHVCPESRRARSRRAGCAGRKRAWTRHPTPR